MTFQTREEARDAVNRQDIRQLYSFQKSGTSSYMYICPICHSGQRQKKTGALQISRDGRHVTCYSGRCFSEKGEDVLGALRILWDTDENGVFERMGYEIGKGNYAPAPASQRKTEEQKSKPAQEKPQDFTADIRRYAEALPGSEGEAYLTRRGFTRSTMERFHLGYDAERRCVTIPYNPKGSYYGRRSTVQGTNRPHDNLTGVKMPLFNSAALYASEVCYIVESPLCAISIEQAGGHAVAISGTSGKSRLMDQLERKPCGAALVLCLDNDEPGRKAAQGIGAALEAVNVFCVDGTSAIMGETTDQTAEEYRKDPNDVLMKSGADALRQAVAEVADITRETLRRIRQDAEEERQSRSGAGMIDTFLADVQTKKYEPLPTGITDIDRAIGGGFMRQQLVLLGAAPGAGKTALAQWIFEGMAKRGVSTVFLNLEMSRDQIIARSFSRIAAAAGYSLRATTVLQGYKWTDEERDAVMQAAEEYKRTIATRIIYNPDGVTAHLDSILSYIEEEARQAEAAFLPAPCVVLDYLQIIVGDQREDAASVIKRAVGELKKYAMRHNTVVFAIIAHNRGSNKAGGASMESARDTSALEYSADLQLALTYTDCLKRNGQPAKSPEELSEEDRKRVTLRVVKARFGGTMSEVDLHFNGGTMTYTQVAKEEDEWEEMPSTYGKRRHKH